MKVAPWHLVVVMLAGWIHREQQKIINYRSGPIRCRLRLGGLLRYYHREAA